jgi:hypothetical protein
MARREPFEMRSKRIEINIVPSRFGPLVTFLDALLLVVAVDVETVAFSNREDVVVGFTTRWIFANFESVHSTAIVS